MRKPVLTNKVLRGLQAIVTNPAIVEEFCGLHDQSLVRQGLALVWVGHINDVGGVCDDCTDEAMSRRSESRVIAYLDATLAVPALDTISTRGDDANVRR